jgi:hypothetical protein
MSDARQSGGIVLGQGMLERRSASYVQLRAKVRCEPLLPNASSLDHKTGNAVVNPKVSMGIEIAHALACALGMKLSELVRKAE